MNKNAFLSIAVILSVLGLSGHALASTQPVEVELDKTPLTQPLKNQPSRVQLSETQPVEAQPSAKQSMALIVAFPKSIDFNITNNQQLSTTLILAQPLVSRSGDLLADVNSPVQAQLIATDDGARIQVEAVVSEGRLLPVQAISSTISFIEESSTEGQKAGRGAGVWGRRGLAVGCLFNNCSADNQMMGGSAGAFLGSFIGQGQSDNQKIVQIPQGSVFILQVQE